MTETVMGVEDFRKSLYSHLKTVAYSGRPLLVGPWRKPLVAVVPYTMMTGITDAPGAPETASPAKAGQVMVPTSLLDKLLERAVADLAYLVATHWTTTNTVQLPEDVAAIGRELSAVDPQSVPWFVEALATMAAGSVPDGSLTEAAVAAAVQDVLT